MSNPYQTIKRKCENYKPYGSSTTRPPHQFGWTSCEKKAKSSGERETIRLRLEREGELRLDIYIYIKRERERERET